MAKIVVTGGSGKAGRAVVRDLLEHGHDVLNVDRVPSADSYSPDTPAPFLPADLTDFGQTLEALSGGERMPGIEAVVHLAAIPSPVHATPDVVFRTNTASTHTVFAAAARLRLRRVVWASSETTLGPAVRRPARLRARGRGARAPGDELRPLEGRRRGDGAPVQPLERHPHPRAALLERHGPRRLRGVPVLPGRPRGAQVEPVGLRRREPRRARASASRSRRTSRARRRSSSRPRTPSCAVRAASSWRAVFPGVRVADHVRGNDTLLDIRKARRMLGYAPAFSWRELF